MDVFVGVHAMETRSSVLINGQRIDGDSARFRVEQYDSELRAAKQQFGHALCLCRTPPLKLVIRQRGDLMHLACWPDDAHHHSPNCSFYTEAYSGAKAEGIVVGQDNRTQATYHQPWTVEESRNHQSAPKQDSIKLWALIHHLWESSRLYSWMPGWQRNWTIAHKVLMRAAKSVIINGDPFVDHLYIPPAFSFARKEEIRRSWDLFIAPIQEQHRGNGVRTTGFVLGEVRSIVPAGQGYLLKLKQHGPGFHIGPQMAKNLTHLARRGWIECTQGGGAGNGQGGTSVVALLRIEALQDGALVAADCVLMRTHCLVPANSNADDDLIDRLMNEKREFIRPLSYRQASLDLPAFVLRDTPIGATELHVLGLGMAPHAAFQRIQQLEAQAKINRSSIWIWNRNESPAMPALPPSNKALTCA